ncbi:MAG: TolC family protein [Planctomycetia bacterium]|nr:TolC family protein [Planctomycetia bacterium]
MLFTTLKNRRAAAVAGMLASLVFVLTGCNRTMYRLRADKEVKYLVEQKSNDPRWDLHSFTIGMDPRSRYFDPTDPDRPPMPYDDPAAHRYMHCIDGKKAYPCWHMNGNRYGLENPRWKELLAQYNEVTPEGAIKLTMNGSVCLAQIHSADYRTQIETIYSSALDLSTERYRFDVQFFGDSNTVFNHANTVAANGKHTESNTLSQLPVTVGANGAALPATYQIQKQFATGGELLVGFANTFVWQFAGTNTTTTNSLFNFAFIQPLLRGGGRVIALETLTLAERTLLYNLRAFQRYRQGFYAAVTVGNSFAGAVQGPTRKGGLLGGTGLTGFTGQGASGFGAIGSVLTGAAIGGGGGGGAGGGFGLAGGGAGPVGGFVGLAQLLQQVRLIQANLDTQLRTLGLLEANLDAGLIDIVQVDSFRQNIETTRATLLQNQITLQSTLDQFKIAILGLPPNLPVEIDDSLLKQFEFIDPKTTSVQHLIEDFVNVVGDLPPEPAEQDLKSALEVLSKLRQRLALQFKAAQADMQRMESVVPVRKKTLKAEQAARFDEDRKKLAIGLAEVEDRFSQTEGVLQNLQNRVGTGERGILADEIVSLATGLSGLTQELSLVKARARVESITIPNIELTSDRALEIARANRLDWMNQRAALIDSYRLIAFNANALKAGVNLTFNGDLGTIERNNPASFNARSSHLSVGVQFDSPFSRRAQRNTYRVVLIQYQAARRFLYQFEDNTNFVLRNLIRTLEQLEVNIEIQRRAVVLAIRRVDKTREDLNKPPAPVQPGQPVETLGPTVAVNLISALTDLQQTQIFFISVVLNHLENRILLYRELGIMELDDCGMWIDKPLNEADWLTAEQCPLPPPVPVEWMQDAGVDPTEVQDYSALDQNGVQDRAADSPAVMREPEVVSKTPAPDTSDPRPLERVRRFAKEQPTPTTRPAEDQTAPKAEKTPRWVPAGRGRRGPDPVPHSSENRNQLTGASTPEEVDWTAKPAPSGPAIRR